MRLITLCGLLAVLLAQSFALQRCATPSPPRGGDRDTLGPVLVPEKTTPNFQTDFRPERIELTFDEWVELDPQQPIVISPPLELPEQPELRRRTLTIPLEGVDLRDSVTYVVNIGAAVTDLNEGNPTENLRFVFATGPVLDTASVSGTVVDAFSGEPQEDITVTLFDNLADTAVFTENPSYFAISDEDGGYTISNIRPGDYRVVALQRNPVSRTYFADYGGIAPPLATGFRDSIITVADDSNRIAAIRVSPVPVEPRISEVETESFGLIKIAVNQPAEQVDLRSSVDYLRSDVGDTIRLFYRAPVRDDTVYIGRDTVFTDTLFFAAEDASTAPAPAPQIDVRIGRTVNPGEGLRIVFNRPLAEVDTSRINLYRDTLDRRLPVRYAIDSIFPASLRIDPAGRDDAGVPYRLQLLPGAVTNWYGNVNSDTIAANFDVAAREGFGNLTLFLRNLNPTVSYILRLVNEEGEVIVGSRRYIVERFEYDAMYTSLEPATYRLELIYDSNHNQRYDAGDLRFGLQPELVRRFEIEPLRANWEVEKTIDLENN